MSQLRSLGVIGLGQIGASLALAARHAGLAEEILGEDRDAEALEYCRENGIISQSASLREIATRCELIILAVPPEAIGPVTLAMVPDLAPGAVLTDVASTKMPVVAFMQNELPAGVSFIPGHPIAGGTRSGPYDANGAVFARKMVMLTPPLGIDINDPGLQRVRNFWLGLDTVVELMPADFHDLVYGYVSHLPHLLAFAASALLADADVGNEPPASFFRFIRLGLSGPALWADIFLQNQHYVLQALRNYLAMLNHIHGELQAGPQEPVPVQPGSSRRVNNSLFTRIAASTLIATVQMIERQSGQRLARYSGAGFADLVSPAAEAPEGDMELISNHYQQVSTLLARYQQLLEGLAAAIEAGQRGLLLKELETMMQANLALRGRIGAPL